MVAKDFSRKQPNIKVIKNNGKTATLRLIK